MSHVYRVLRSGQYQATADWDRKKEFHIFVKADTFYCDEREKISGEVSVLFVFNFQLK